MSTDETRELIRVFSKAARTFRKPWSKRKPMERDYTETGLCYFFFKHRHCIISDIAKSYIDNYKPHGQSRLFYFYPTRRHDASDKESDNFPPDILRARIAERIVRCLRKSLTT